MAVLGHRGCLQLRREVPDPLVLPITAVHLLSDGLFVSNPGYWSGDEITLINAGGLPLDAGEGAAACPDGHAVYVGSDWDLGANRNHVANDEDAFYQAYPAPDSASLTIGTAGQPGFGMGCCAIARQPADVTPLVQNWFVRTNAGFANYVYPSADGNVGLPRPDDAPFYLREEDVGLLEIASFYVYRDQLDRLSFYTSRAAALRGSTTDRVSLFRVNFGSLLLAPLGSDDYQNALLVCSGELNQSDHRSSYIHDETILTSVCNSVPVYQSPLAETENSEDADRGYWNVQGQMSEWTLNLNAQEIDTTAVGERFGDSVKSLVTGGGQVDFLVARTNQMDSSGAPIADSTTLMQLLLLQERGCKADAQFWMIDDQADAGKLLPGDLFYEAQLLITSMAINTRATDIIAGSCNFVTVREIRLKMGSN